ncbi:DUF960 family protein [Enterococcus sp. HY326]|uniref:DUF960 family protein n=1 Tax=Enterococcus sp. HY326 TaxID=2971265 RepID=UPI003A1039F2
MIDTKEEKGDISLDYLQIFEFNPDQQRQSIEVIHHQEEPFVISHHQYPLTTELAHFHVKKVWVIDDGSYQTMLLPDEY